MTHPNGAHQQQTKWPGPEKYLRTQQKIIFCWMQNCTPSLVLLAMMATSDPTSLQVKCWKGKKISADKECQLVLNFLLICQDPVCGNPTKCSILAAHC
jgi:hypothetical protein